MQGSRFKTLAILATLAMLASVALASVSHAERKKVGSITVTFKRNGRYDDEGLKKLNYFLRDWRNDEQTRMDPQLFDILWEVSREVDTREAVRIVSSYRSPATNSQAVAEPAWAGRTTTGCSRPFSLIDAARSANSFSANSRRGWKGLGTIDAIARVLASTPPDLSSSPRYSPRRAPSPFPKRSRLLI